ncbi:NADH-quinone oxidoreductase subunit NuoF [Candidatus Bipolaricaulota bacterium]|nr:NADH-quinone oxidoreductase subunit NuoF [Candidatus Bipolaricaulota bacterium]
MSIEELNQISDRVEQENAKYEYRVMLCAGTACVSNDSFEVKEALEDEITDRGLEEKVLIETTGCNGFCALGPVMTVMPDGIFYQSLTKEDVTRLVEEHFIEDSPIEDLMYSPPGQEESIPNLSNIDFFSSQTPLVLKNRGLIDPEKIDEYIARDGYKALEKALTSMTPEEIVNEIKDSGLRGRGGAGFPTGQKWEFARAAEGEEKYLVCNADEGDPGAYMDRSIIESDPHSVLEGMLIGAKAMGAAEGFVYIRDEYPLAVKRLKLAIEQAKDYGLLGENIFGTDFSFDINIARGAGAFVCGEETSLMASIEGGSPEPRHRPPFPAQSGLWGQPTNINNVETWANVPTIINRGAEWFAKLGTEESKGTKVFSLVGNINNTGLVEVPMGITLEEIIYDIGGGIPEGKEFKAVQTGGPSGGCIPAELIDLPVDYERLTEAGSIMGSGGLIVMDEDTCMVDTAKYFIEFTNDESCGKCSSCRDGSTALLEILERICDGEGREGDIDLLEELSRTITEASQCGLGQTLPNPVLTTLKYFRDEYEEHVKNNRCPAKVCQALIEYSIDEDKCTGCGLCAKNCPQNAITGKDNEPREISPKDCVKCGICQESCNFGAVLLRDSSQAKSETKVVN